MRLALVSLLLLVMAIPAFATESKINALGGIPGLVPDDTDVIAFPTALSSYRNFAVGEFRAVNTPFTGRTGGVHFYIESFEADVAVYVNRVAPVNFLQHNYANLVTVNQEHLLLVSKNGLAGGIGIGVDSYGLESDPDPVDGTITDESASILSLHAGYNVEFDSGVAELGGHFWTGSGTQEFQGDVAEDIDDSGTNIAVAARVTQDKGNGVNWVGIVGFQTWSGELMHSGGEDNKRELSGTSIVLGGAVQKAVTKKTDVILGIAPFLTNKAETTTYVDATEVTTTNTVTATALPALFFAMETEVWNWLTGWVGVNKTLVSTKVKNEVDNATDTSNEATNRTAPFAISLGGAIHVSDNFRIEGVLNNNWLFNGPNFLSGANPLNLMNQISVVGTW